MVLSYELEEKIKYIPLVLGKTKRGKKTLFLFFKGWILWTFNFFSCLWIRAYEYFVNASFQWALEFTDSGERKFNLLQSVWNLKKNPLSWVSFADLISISLFWCSLISLIVIFLSQKENENKKKGLYMRLSLKWYITIMFSHNLVSWCMECWYILRARKELEAIGK